MDKEDIKISTRATELLLFMKDKEISFNSDEIITWINFYDIEEFIKIFNSSIFVDDGGLDVKLQENCIVLNLKEIIEYHFIGEEEEYIISKLKEME